MNCLAATGIDAAPFVLIGAALLVVGIVVAVVVARRGYRHAATFAVLPLALGLLLGAGLLSASPAQAATPGSCSTPTPTPACTPATPVADRAIDDLDWTLVDDTFSTIGDPADVAAMLDDQAAIAAIDSGATFVLSYDYDGTPPSPDSAGNAVSTDDLSGTTGTVSFDSTVHPPASVLGNVTYAVTFHIDWTYANGCGGTLTTHQTFVGTLLVIGGTA